MKDYIKERSKDIAVYMIENQCTVRQAAREFGVSRSTVHNDITKSLPKCEPLLYKEVRKILDKNKRERALRGGLALKAKIETAKKD